MTLTKGPPSDPTLRDLIAAEQERFAVPGLAVAIVAHGEVVLCEGFGHTSPEHPTVVTADTHFPIASDTKAFTAAALAVLATTGSVELDVPLMGTLPGFGLRDPFASAQCTLRDLLCHRSGLPRHDLVWYGRPDLTHADVTSLLPHLEPTAAFRQTWQYSNLGYHAAGHALEHTTGLDWVDALDKHLLAPLGMGSTVDTLLAPEVLLPAWPCVAGPNGTETRPLPLPALARAAGGLITTARDMVQWLRARLGHHPDVLSPAVLELLHTPSMVGTIPGMPALERLPMGYALGCQVESFRGKRLIRHGGNIVGYSSDVLLLPDDDVGIAVLTNLHGAPLPQALGLRLVEHLLGLPDGTWGSRLHEFTQDLRRHRDLATSNRQRTAGTLKPLRPVEECVGTYSHPAYGTLTVSSGTGPDGQLRVAWHRLREEIVLTHHKGDCWDLTIRDVGLTMALTFQADQQGRVEALRLQTEAALAPVTFARS